jgi:hypothetical protein
MSRTLQFKRYSTVALANTTGANGELIIDSTTDTVTVHDGSTVGGTRLATELYARGQANTTVAQDAYNQANTATDLAQSAYNQANTGIYTGGTISGNVVIQGNLDVSGNTTVLGDAVANTIIIETTLYSGLATRSATPLPHLIAQFTSNSASYVQVNTQNINPDGSADFVITADNGDDTNYYLDLGLHGSQHYDKMLGPYDGYLLVQGSTIGQAGGNLIIGTISSFPTLQTMFVAGGYEANNVVMKLGTYGANVVGNLTVTGTMKGGVPGPYSNDSQASSAGVPVGNLYYSANGAVYIRLT